LSEEFPATPDDRPSAREDNVRLPYDVHEIEEKWRRRWRDAHQDEPRLDQLASPDDTLFYNLIEFPYPSAEGLHVGHFFKYSGVDAYGRYQRMRGHVLFEPIGFDAFGIHTENFALRTGEHPATLTARTVSNFRAQLSRGGMAWDWSRSLDTSDPRYYRWTQWILTRMFAAGLMYQAEAPVVWCPSCLTVLAREQTEGDNCERCATPVTERLMRQWFLRSTAYADRLLDGLDRLDWPERAKRLQRQWIGRSAGREIDFGDVTVFTTRPETLPAASFVAVAAGHPAAGGTRPHPLTREPLPVVEAPYVIETYGTGAVMGVPAFDERDRRFALLEGLPYSDAGLLDEESAARVGRAAVRYRMRDWLISRQRYWGPPIPIVHCGSCGPVAVPESELPVLLPYVEDFRPTGTGLAPLASVPEFVNAPCPGCGGPGRRETDVSDTFVDSAWCFLRYPSAELDDRPWDVDRTRQPDFYAGGPEHIQRHHLYARFCTMVLFDMGLVPFEEPFPRIRLGGLIVKEGARMSKSRGNVVSPDGYIAAHGADVLRCALLFTCPWGVGGDFHDQTIAGIERFFARLWVLVEAAASAGPPPAPPHSPVTDPAIARAVVAVGDAIERLRFNVAIARLMEAVEAVETAETCRPADAASSTATETRLRTVVKLLAPLAPHLAEELWERLGGTSSVHLSPWPTVDPSAVEAGQVTIVVQVDGRVRHRLLAPRGAGESAVVAAAVELVGVRPARVVYVPDRLVNLVTSSGSPRSQG
jgi:leucyl-tRNA synthetase